MKPLEALSPPAKGGGGDFPAVIECWAGVSLSLVASTDRAVVQVLLYLATLLQTVQWDFPDADPYKSHCIIPQIAELFLGGCLGTVPWLSNKTRAASPSLVEAPKLDTL